MDDRCDLTFYNIVKEENSYVSFLDSVFGFLFRCTDFYQRQTGSVELPSKGAEDLVLETFQKYQALARKNEDVHCHLSTCDGEIPAACQEIVLETAQDPQLDMSLMTTLTLSSSSKEETVHLNLATSESEIPAACQEIVLETAERALHDTQLVVEDDLESYRRICENEEFYNGDDRGDYQWSQSLTDADITIPTPKRLCKANQVKVEITASSLMVKFLSEKEQNWEEILHRPLAFNVIPQDSYWSLVPSSHLQVYLEKKHKEWWDRLFPCDPPIDPRKIDTSELEDELCNYDRLKIQEAISMNEQSNDPVYFKAGK